MTCDKCHSVTTASKPTHVDVQYKPGFWRRIWAVLCVGCFKTRAKQATKRHARVCG